MTTLTTSDIADLAHERLVICGPVAPLSASLRGIPSRTAQRPSPTLTAAQPYSDRPWLHPQPPHQGATTPLL